MAALPLIIHISLSEEWYNMSGKVMWLLTPEPKLQTVKQ
jgi:hypothetical protein